MLIAFGHESGVGKDVAADYLVKQYGFVRRGFADSMKTAAAAIFGWDEVELYGANKERYSEFWGMTPRKSIQLLGTDACKPVFGKDVWIKSVFASMAPETNYVISDCRFPEEVNAVWDAGGFCVRIVRHERTLPSNPNHISETALAEFHDWDLTIHNDGTLAEFYENLDITFENLKAKAGTRAIEQRS